MNFDANLTGTSGSSKGRTANADATALGRLFAAGMLLLLCGPACAAENGASLLDTAAQHRREGNLRLAIELLEKACKPLSGPPCSPALMGELGAAYYQAHRFAQAAEALNDA